MLSLGMEGASGLHYLIEVIRARSSGRSAALSCHHHVVPFALAILSFGGLGYVLLLVLAWPIIMLGGHRLFLTSIPVSHVEEVFYRFQYLRDSFLSRSGSLTPFLKD